MTGRLLQDSPMASQTRVTGAEIVLRTLEAEGVEVCFGMPGGAILPIYDAIALGTTIRHVLVRHEQGAGHMAQGYARACGRSTVLDVHVDPDEACFPMILPGGAAVDQVEWCDPLP